MNVKHSTSRKRRGFILFTTLLIAFFLILMFQVSFQSVVSTIHVERMSEVYNQMVCTAKTALYKALDGQSSSGTFPTGDYYYDVSHSGDTYTITVKHGSLTMKFTAKARKTDSGKEVVYSWKRD